jgi:hypothetical protein
MINKEVYFDTNVYTHILNVSLGRIRESGGVTSDNVKLLMKLLKSDRLRVLASVTNVEEAISAYLNHPEESIEKLKIIRRLAKRKRMINAHFEMAKNDVVAFAQGKALPSPFVSPPSLLIDFLARPKSVDPKLFRRVAEDTKAHIEEIRKRHGEYFSDDRQHADELKADNTQPSFEEYWNRHSLPGLEIIAEDCGVLEQCRNRGIENLLQLRSIRIGLFANLSMRYASTFEGRLVDMGYSRDMHHAILSAATGVFITHDKKFRRLITRMNFPDYSVMSLKELLHAIS